MEIGIDRLTTQTFHHDRVYKVVDRCELEISTRMGWRYEESFYEPRTMALSTRKLTSPSSYSYGATDECERRDEIGEVPVFLLSRGANEADLEVTAQSQLRRAQREVDELKGELDAERHERVKDIEREKQRDAEVMQLRKDAADIIVKLNDQAAKSRNVETDIAKLRSALGELRMKEILATE